MSIDTEAIEEINRKLNLHLHQQIEEGIERYIRTNGSERERALADKLVALSQNYAIAMTLVKDLAQGDRMSETEGTLLARFKRLRERARELCPQ